MLVQKYSDFALIHSREGTISLYGAAFDLIERLVFPVVAFCEQLMPGRQRHFYEHALPALVTHESYKIIDRYARLQRSFQLQSHAHD